MQRTTAIEFYLRTCYGKLGCFCLILMSELKNISLSVVSTVDEYFFTISYSLFVLGVGVKLRLLENTRVT